MKRRVVCIGLVFMFLLICPLQIGLIRANAETPTSGECGESALWNYDAATGTLTISGTGAMQNYGGNLQAPWSAYSKDIQKIVIQQGITVIGSGAFRRTYAKTVEIGASVEKIEMQAFDQCVFLKEIHFKGSAPTINMHAFSSVTATAFYPADDTTWTTGKEQNLFNSNLTWCADDGKGAQVSDVHGDVKWELKGDTLYIEPTDGSKSTYMQPQPAWLDYKGVIKKVVMTGVIEVIGIGAFDGCSELREVQWSTGVKTIGMETFKGCTSLESLEIPDSVTHISIRAFSGCSGLKTIHLPKDLTEVDVSAFKGCSGLKSITFPANAMTIKESAFEGCKSLESIYFTGPMPTVYASGGSTGVNVQIGTTQIPMTSFGTFGKIDSTVTVYYPENAEGWTEALLQKIAEPNITFTAYRQESDDAETPPVENPGPADKEHTEPSVPATEPEPIVEENTPSAGDSQAPTVNVNETQQTVPGDVTEDPTQKKNGTKWWIPVVIVAVVTVGTAGAVWFIKQKKN